MNWARKLITLARSPRAFFSSVAREPAQTAFVALACLQLARAAVPLLSPGGFPVSVALVSFAIEMVVALLMVCAAHGAVRLLGGKHFGQTFKAFIYPDILMLVFVVAFELVNLTLMSGPHFITGELLLAAVILVTLLWSLALTVFGLRALHKLSTGKAIFVVIVGIAAVFLLRYSQNLLFAAAIGGFL